MMLDLLLILRFGHVVLALKTFCFFAGYYASSKTAFDNGRVVRRRFP
jgi:hypothetical protein